VKRAEGEIPSGGDTVRLDAWRDAVIERLRSADLGEFEYHAFRASERQIRLADMLAGRLTEQAFASTDYGPDFFDIYGFKSAGQPGAVIDWTATSADALVREKSDYGTFVFAIPLAASYWKTGDVAYMRRWFSIAADFARNQRKAVEAIPVDKRRMDNAPWVVGALPCLHQGDRVRNLIRCLAVFAKSLPAAADGSKPEWAHVLRPLVMPAGREAVASIPIEDLATIVQSLTSDHPKQLLDFYYHPGAWPNQRSGGLEALLMLGHCFPDAPGMSEVSTKAGEAMTEYLTSSFQKDGGMLEQSLNYNIGEFVRLREIGRMLQREPPPWMPILTNRVRGFHRLLVGISTPMHELPVIGNNTSNPPAAWASEGVRRDWFEKQLQASPRIDSASCDFSSVAFPYSGYYAQRRDWRWDSPYLFMTNARPSYGHHSMDNLAIELHAYGRPLLVRGGPPPYGIRYLPVDRSSDIDKVAEYFGEHSSWKVNTVLVDGQSQAKSAKWADAGYEKPVDGRWHSSQAFDLVDGRYSLGYGPHDDSSKVDFTVSHQRRAIHVRNLSCWVVTDTMSSPDGEDHEFTQIWKFPPLQDLNDARRMAVCGFSPEQVLFGDRIIRTADPQGPNLSLYHFTNVPLSYSKHVGEANPYRGWYARSIGDLLPAVDMHATWKARGKSTVTTVLWPTPSNAPPIKAIADSSAERDPTVSAFTATLKDGATLAFSESVAEPRRLEAAGIRITGEMLLVTRQGRDVKGLVLGCTEWTDGRYKIRPTQPDFEFVCRADGGFDVVAPIETPNGFGWIETSRGVRPDYREPAKPPAARAPAPAARVREVARVVMPNALPDETGKSIPISGLCGVAWLGDDRYVAVPKTGDHMIVFRLPITASGSPNSIVAARAVPIGGPGHRTDVAFDETGQQLLVVDDVEPLVYAGRIGPHASLKRLGVPTAQTTARAGKGLSAITVDRGTHAVWIANREALPADGLPAIGRLGTVVRLSEVVDQPAKEGSERAMKSRREVFYQADPAHEGRRVTPSASSSGVAAVAAVGDGRLLVLEASRAPTIPPFRSRLFFVDSGETSGADGATEDKSLSDDQPVQKTLVWEQSGGVCLEGLCVGPTLPNGDRVLVAVGDNDSLGTPTTLVVLRLSPSNRRSPFSGPASPLLVGLAALGAAWGVSRLARGECYGHSVASQAQADPARLVLM
jgi:hypothetical protein